MCSNRTGRRIRAWVMLGCLLLGGNALLFNTGCDSELSAALLDSVGTGAVSLVDAAFTAIANDILDDSTSTSTDTDTSS